MLSRVLERRKPGKDEKVESGENAYPIQPLILTTDEHQRTAPPCPLSARASGALNGGRASALSAILLCVFSLSTFVAYEMGLHTGSVEAAAQAPICQAMEYIVLEGSDAPFVSYPGNRVIVSNDNSVQYVHLVRTGYYFAGPDAAWYSVGDHGPQAAAQCMGGERVMFLPARH